MVKRLPLRFKIVKKDEGKSVQDKFTRLELKDLKLAGRTSSRLILAGNVDEAVSNKWVLVNEGEKKEVRKSVQTGESETAKWKEPCLKIEQLFMRLALKA